MSGRLSSLALRPIATALLFAAPPLSAVHAQAAPPEHAHGAAPPASTPAAPAAGVDQPTDMDAMDMGKVPGEAAAASGDSNAGSAAPPMDMGATQGASAEPMKMGSMQGGRAPAGARDPNAFADGYENSTLPGFEKTDQLAFSMMLVDQLEVFSGNEGQGIAWSGQFARGPDKDKFWFRTQGLRTSRDRLDPYTGVEALWWHAYSPFWGRTLGVRQDLGRGAHTWLAFGIEGLAPYWFDVELTGYVSDNGNLSARLKGSYDVLLTNRLIMTPSIESNLFSKKQTDRQLGAGLSNLELGLRLRYEIRRKFAPYIGLVWERSFGGTADFKRLEGDPVTERRLVAGFRLWW